MTCIVLETNITFDEIQQILPLKVCCDLVIRDNKTSEQIPLALFENNDILRQNSVEDEEFTLHDRFTLLESVFPIGYTLSLATFLGRSVEFKVLIRPTDHTRTVFHIPKELYICDGPRNVEFSVQLNGNTHNRVFQHPLKLRPMVAPYTDINIVLKEPLDSSEGLWCYFREIPKDQAQTEFKTLRNKTVLDGWLYVAQMVMFT